MPEHTFEPMGIGQIFDRSFRLYRQNFIQFLAIVAVIHVPVVLIQVGIQSYVFGKLQEQMATGEFVATSVADSLVPHIAVGLLGWLAMLLASGALAKGIAESYLGHSVSVGGVYRFVLPKLWALVVATIVVVGLVFLIMLPTIGIAIASESVALSIIVGLVSLIFVLIVILRLWLATQIVVIENTGGLKAVGRSWGLTRGYGGKIFLVLLVIGIIGMVADWGAGLVTGPMVGRDNLQSALVIQGLVGAIVGILIAPITAGALVMLYFDLRIRKEAFDLEMLAEQMGAEPSESAYQPQSQPPLEP
jgi:hypothetical protein